MSTDSFADFDDARIQEFEKSWLADDQPNLAEFLPPENDPKYSGTLEELVHIDLEFRWKQFEKTRDVPARTVEDYLNEFPILKQVKLRLIQSEFELANRFGDRPSPQSFIERFGQEVEGSQLRPILQSVLSHINVSALTVKPGVTMGRYKIVTEQGRGGFGAVWRATDTKLGRRIAVKQLGQQLARDAESRRRFMSEARVTAKLEHPGIVPVYDISSQDDEFAYYTMRLIQGRTMAEAIERLHGSGFSTAQFELERQKLLQSFIDACQTIEYSHSMGVLHRDLKPQNMIVGDYGETIILDWGLASLTDSEVDPTESILHSDPEVLSQEESIETLRGSVMGTPAYMPPEQARGDLDSVSRRSDVYSLGATLYHLVTGKVPFTDQPIDEILERVKKGQIPPAVELNNEVEKPLSAIIGKAMKVEPDERYASVKNLMEDVQRFMADQPVRVFQDSLLASTMRWIRKKPTTAATLALLTLFVLTGMIASILIKNQWDQREEKRITDLQIAAERADATALSQIKSGRFESAQKILSEAALLIQNEPRLDSFKTTLVEREQRTTSILEFYRLSLKAQEETFFDQVDRSAKYCQAALDKMGVLKNNDWWTRLPDDDLTAQQREQLTTEIYRILGLLSTMRLAETTETFVQFQMLTNPQKLDSDDPTLKNFQAARHAAAQGNRFRTSRAMQLVESAGDFATGKEQTVDLTKIIPTNSIDCAIMGSILDSNVPNEGPVRAAVSAILQFQNPNEVASRWLDEAIRDNADWFWLPIFRAINLMKAGQPEAAEKYLSHAIGIRPDYWAGYQYRAWANAIAAQREGITRRQRMALLNASGRDIQRAMDLEKNNSNLYWMQAYALSLANAPQSQIIDSYLQALSLHPMLTDLEASHFSSVTNLFLSYINQFVATERQAQKDSADLRFLEATGLVWQGELDQALAICNADQDQENRKADFDLLKSLILSKKNTEEIVAMQSLPSDHVLSWQLAISAASRLRSQEKFDDETQYLELAVENAKSQYNRSQTAIARAINSLERGQETSAIDLLASAVEIDLAIDLSAPLETAQAAGLTEAVEFCEEHIQQVSPFSKSGMSDSEIQLPALLNGDFELGLSYYWAPFSSTTQSSAWNNFGESRTAASSSSLNAQSGDRCLRLDLNCPNDDGSYGIMTQSINVSANKTYRLRFWAAGTGLSPGSIKVGTIDLKDEENGQFATLPNGNFDWRRFEIQITTTDSQLPISVMAKGDGELRLDNFQIELVQ